MLFNKVLKLSDVVIANKERYSSYLGYPVFVRRPNGWKKIGTNVTCLKCKGYGSMSSKSWQECSGCQSCSGRGYSKFILPVIDYPMHTSIALFKKKLIKNRVTLIKDYSQPVIYISYFYRKYNVPFN
jgi:hypothetical protein